MERIRYLEDQEEFSKLSGKNLLVFGSEKCSACRNSKEKLKQIAEELKDKEIGKMGYVELTEGVKVKDLQSLPSIIIYQKNKKPILIEGFNEMKIRSYL